MKGNGRLTDNHNEFDSIDVHDLVSRINRGDREAAALFFETYRDQIRRRIRRSLSEWMRPLFDSMEIASTLGRRFDDFVRMNKVRARTEGELWSLINTMTRNAIVDKSRILRNLRRVEGADAQIARDLLHQLTERESSNNQQSAEDEIQQALSRLPDEIDRQILLFWLNGKNHLETSQWLCMSHESVRQRWIAIRKRLQSMTWEGS